MKFAHHQCDLIGQFLKLLINIFSCKSSPNINDFWSLLKNSTFYVKSALADSWATFEKIGLLFIPTSGYTAHHRPSRRWWRQRWTNIFRKESYSFTFARKLWLFITFYLSLSFLLSLSIFLFVSLSHSFSTSLSLALWFFKKMGQTPASFGLFWSFPHYTI